MRSTILLAVAVVALLLVPTARAADEVSFTKDVKPFLEKYCNTCHMGAKAKAGVLTDTYDNLLKNTRKKVVVAGKPDMSALVLTMEGNGGKKMPPKKEKSQPTAAEIAKVKDWVKAGAKNDTKTSALPLTRGDEFLAMLLERPVTLAFRPETFCKLD